MKVIHTDKVKPSRDHKPRDLKHAAKDRVEIRVPDVVGKTSPPWKYGIIHSKLMISDEYVQFQNQFVNINVKNSTPSANISILEVPMWALEGQL